MKRRIIAEWDDTCLNIIEEIESGDFPMRVVLDRIPSNDVVFLRRTNRDGLIGSIVDWKGRRVRIKDN